MGLKVGLHSSSSSTTATTTTTTTLLRWREGEAFVFDDSFEHSVFHNGDHPRLVLILDVWHPELVMSSSQKRKRTSSSSDSSSSSSSSSDRHDDSTDDAGYDDAEYNDDEPLNQYIPGPAPPNFDEIFRPPPVNSESLGADSASPSSSSFWAPPNLGPPVTVLRNNVKHYPQLAKRFGIRAPSSSSGVLGWVQALTSEGGVVLVVLVAVAMIWSYYRAFLAPQFARLNGVLEKRRAAKEKANKKAAELRLKQYLEKTNKKQEKNVAGGRKGEK
jgi:hypothetical protein